MYIILSIVCLIVAVVSFLLCKLFAKVTKPTSKEIIKCSIDNLEYLNGINPLVKDIYLQFIDKEGIKYFQEDYCNIFISNIDVSFWHANDVYSRKFTKIPEDILKKYNLTLKEINDTLSLADKTILDNIANAIKVNNKEFISRLFI